MYLPGFQIFQENCARLLKKNVKISNCKTKKMQNYAMSGGFPWSDPEGPFVTLSPPLWRPLPFQGTSCRVMVTSDHISEGCYLEPDLHIIKVKIRTQWWITNQQHVQQLNRQFWRVSNLSQTWQIHGQGILKFLNSWTDFHSYLGEW